MKPPCEKATIFDVGELATRRAPPRRRSRRRSRSPAQPLGVEQARRGRREAAGREALRRRRIAVGEELELVRLGLDDDLRHRLHRLDREAAGGGLAGEHQRVGAVEHRVGDVRRLGAGRARLLHHRLEHLRRDDHRLAGAPPGGDDLASAAPAPRGAAPRRRGRRAPP